MLKDRLPPKYLGLASRGFAAAALLALAACGDEEAPAPEASSTSQVPSASVQANASWLDLAPCGQPQTGAVHYRVGGAVVVLEQAIVQRVVLSQGSLTQEIDPAKPLGDQLPKGTGCADNPLSVAGVITRSEFQSDLLEGSVTLFPVIPELIGSYQQVVTQLREQRPANACQDEQDGLLICFGQERQNDVATDVAYVIAADTNIRLATGGPLFARCEIQEGRPVGCNLGDAASQQIFYDATLRRTPTSAADLKAAHDQVREKFAAFRNAGNT
ncbi:MAG: hypothetical protein AAGC81_12290 [Pseudomonadota bacterium]